jgi:hypothetical protein
MAKRAMMSNSNVTSLNFRLVPIHTRIVMHASLPSCYSVSGWAWFEYQAATFLPRLQRPVRLIASQLPAAVLQIVDQAVSQWTQHGRRRARHGKRLRPVPDDSLQLWQAGDLPAQRDWEVACCRAEATSIHEFHYVEYYWCRVGSTESWGWFCCVDCFACLDYVYGDEQYPSDFGGHVVPFDILLLFSEPWI